MASLLIHCLCADTCCCCVRPVGAAWVGTTFYRRGSRNFVLCWRLFFRELNSALIRTYISGLVPLVGAGFRAISVQNGVIFFGKWTNDLEVFVCVLLCIINITILMNSLHMGLSASSRFKLKKFDKTWLSYWFVFASSWSTGSSCVCFITTWLFGMISRWVRPS